MNILKIENLYKSFGKQEVLKGVNLEINKPGIYALIGPNGSGKTTLFNVISNLLKATKGSVEVVGKKNTDSNIFYEVSFLKDNRVLYDYLSGYDHLAFIRTIQKLPQERLDEVIDLLGIRHYINKRVGDYSLGMKQHLLIAMAVMNKPKLMILDEPLNGLDPTAIIRVRNLFLELSKSGTAVVISSHTLSEIDLLTENIMFLKDGKIVEEKIDRTNENRYELSLDKDNMTRFKKLELKLDIKFYDNKVLVNLKDQKIADFILDLKSKGIEVDDISKRKRGSEERYIEMFVN